MGGGGGGVEDKSSLISASRAELLLLALEGRGGFSGGVSERLAAARVLACLAGRGGGWSSLDEAELRVDAMLFCEGELLMWSPFIERLIADERLSLAASERSGRLAVSCWVSSITGELPPSAAVPLLFTASVEDVSKELILAPENNIKKNP